MCRQLKRLLGCRLLGLAAVEVDALGRPTWECTDADIAQAYRRLAVLVHPDKTSHLDHPRSREAFENLNAAHRILKDPGKRADEMGKQLENARKRRALLEANATGAERLALNAERVAQVPCPLRIPAVATQSASHTCPARRGVCCRFVYARAAEGWRVVVRWLQAAQLRQEEASELHARTKGHMERAREAAAQKRKLREQAEERHSLKATASAAQGGGAPGAVLRGTSCTQCCRCWLCARRRTCDVARGCTVGKQRLRCV